MKIRYHIASSMFGRILVNIAKKQNNNDRCIIKVLLYHDVPYNSFDKFNAQINWIHNKYGFINPEDLGKIFNGQMKYTGTRILLTFDDGYKSNVLLAKKILDPLGIKGIFFVPTGFINAKNRKEQLAFIITNIYDNRINPGSITDDMRPMSWEDIECLVNTKHAIGAHSINHRRLSMINSIDELKSEIVESGAMLKKKLDIEVKHFSYPFGDIKSIDQRAMHIIRKNYKYCYSGIRGNNYNNTYPYSILRDSVTIEDPQKYVEYIIENGLEVVYRKREIILSNMTKSDINNSNV